MRVRDRPLLAEIAVQVIKAELELQFGEVVQ
jgi:hypothetical protein